VGHARADLAVGHDDPTDRHEHHRGRQLPALGRGSSAVDLLGTDDALRNLAVAD
jgi:hypothetical protein